MNNIDTEVQEEKLVTEPVKEKKFPNLVYVISIFTWIGCFVGIQFIGGFIYLAIVGILSVVKNIDFELMWTMDHFLFACSLASAVIIPAACALIAVNKKKTEQSFANAFSEYTHVHKLQFMQCVNYISIGVFMAFVSGLILSIVLSIFPDNSLLGSAASLDISVWTGLSTLFLAPIGEEFLMRCVIFDLLKKYRKPIRANITQSILFGLLHGVSLQTVYTAFIGYIMGYEVHNKNNLTCSLMMHFGFNLSAGLSCIFPLFTETTAYNIGMLCMLVYGCVMFILMCMRNKKSNIKDNV